MWEVFKAYREQSWFPKVEEPKKKTRVKDDPEYFKKYYDEHAEERREYAKKYYQENRDKLYNNRLTKNQQLVYNYCIQEHYPSWEILSIYHISQALGLKPYYVWKSLNALVNKSKLFSDWEHIYVDWIPTNEVTEVSLFSDEPDLYENVNLEDENFALKRKLKNAEDRYMKLLGEYTEYKEAVKNAYIEFEDEERNYNHALWVLDKVIMNR